MDLKAKFLSETCLDPIEYLRQLRQTTEPIGGGTEYCEDGELVEYDVAIEAVGKANKAFIEKACEWIEKNMDDYIHVEYDTATGKPTNEAHIAHKKVVEDFEEYMKEE